MNIQKLRRYGINIFSWLVKGAGVGVLLLILAIFIGEGPPNPFKLTPRELLLFASLFTTLVGLVLALWKQLIGGILILLGIIAFAGEGFEQWLFWAFVLIGIGNMLCWLLRKLTKDKPDCQAVTRR